MRYVCRRYYLNAYRYIYGMITKIKSDNNWYEVILYMHNKMKYSHIYLCTYDLPV